MIVSSKTVKPQNVRACAAPGTVHFSSLRCPITSTVSVATSRPGCPRTAAIRSGAGCPLIASRFSHHSRRPAIANAAAVRKSPMTIRTSIDNPMTRSQCRDRRLEDQSIKLY